MKHEHDRRIVIGACARYCGQTETEFVNDWIDAGIVATFERHAEESGGQGKPGDLLNRREIAALKSPLSVWTM